MKKNLNQEKGSSFEKKKNNYPALTRIYYFDEVLDKEFAVEYPWQTDRWQIYFNGSKHLINFLKIEKSLRSEAKRFFIEKLLEHKISLIVMSYTALINFSIYINEKCIEFRSINAKALHTIYYEWKNTYSTSTVYEIYIRSFLIFLCKISYAELSPKYTEEIKHYKVSRRIRDARIKSGDSKLSFKEEFLITLYLDSRLEFWRNHNDSNIPIEGLLKDAVLVICFCLGLRAKQLAMLKLNSISENGSEHKYYDIAVPVIKQRGRYVEPMRKALPSKWQDIIIIFWRLRKRIFENRDLSKIALLSINGDTLLPHDFTEFTKELTFEIIGEPKTVHQFRHTFAQRLADAGASSIEIATALTHVTTETAQVYIEASPQMGKIISEAMGKSSVYKDLPDLFSGRLKIKAEYEAGESDNKITGIVDGIIMPGIGLCDVGLKLCDRSPLLSCHTCPKFMPVLDAEPHEKLANQLRLIVNRFKNEAIDQNQPSPPLAKLGTTLAVIEGLIDKIKELSNA